MSSLRSRVAPHVLFVSLVAVVPIAFAIGSESQNPGEKLSAGAIIDTALVLDNTGLVRGPNSNAFTVFSRQTRKWDCYAFPEALTIEPCTLGESGPKENQAIIGFEMNGAPVKELVAVDTSGVFCKLPLKTAIDRAFIPVLKGKGVLFYIVDGRVYAFSGITGTWDDLEVPRLHDVTMTENITVSPEIEDGFDTETTDGIVVQLAQGTAAFMPNVGRWKIQLNGRPTGK